VAAAQAVGTGDLSYRIAEQPDARELQQLGRELNTMAARLESARAVEVRQAEEQVALERRLQEAEKMAAIGNLAAGLAHEIAAPLNVISGRAELLLRREHDPPARERHLRLIVQQISRITTIVRNLLDFARQREPRVQTLPLQAVVDGVVEFLESELDRAGVRVIRDPGEEVQVQVDPDLLHQVLTNLTLNAVQAMEQGGERREIVFRVGRADGAAWLELQDSGPGIASEATERLFEPFFTTKPRGTGLGLAVARSIVEAHHGTLSAANAPQGGAVFRVTLPAAAGHAAPVHA
jgi:signal transduction histidine kinase